MQNHAASWPIRVDFVLTRLAVPGWILLGALFKLWERTPGNLPSGIVAIAKQWRIDLELLMRTLIGLELFAVGVMLFVPRLARPMAVFMLTSFCGILIWELIRQSTKCGCFGDLPVKPWQMLVIDGSLLLGVQISWILALPSRQKPHESWSKSMALTAIVAIAGMAISFGVPDRPLIEQTTEPEPPSLNSSNPTHVETQPAEVDPTQNPSPAPIPGSWYVPGKVEDWIGQSWRDLSLFQLMRKWPSELDRGKHYVIFYGRTCEHCQDMFYDDLMIPWDTPIAVIEIPHSRTVMTSPEGAWDMPRLPSGVELLQLPLGCDYLIQSPLALRIEEGKITCAQEGDHKACLEMQ